MKLFFDNTGVQAAFRALKGETNPSSPEYDAEAILQFFVTSIFSDRIYINGFEADFIRERTKASCAELNKLLKAETAFVLDVDLDSYRQSCLAAAEIAARELEFVDGTNFALARTELIELPRTGPQRIVDSLDLVSLPEGNHALREKEKYSLEREKAIATVEFMFAASERLRASIRVLNKANTWSDAHTVNLHSFLRFRLNSELSAFTKNALYTPSPDRAHLLQHIPSSLADPSSILERLDREIELVSDQGRMGRANDLPVLVGFLLKKSGGYLNEMAGLVRELRAETKLLRAELADAQTKTPIQQQAIVGKYGRVLRQSLGIDEPPKKAELRLRDIPKRYGFREAILVALSYPRFLSEEIKSNKTWIEFMAEQAKLSVITEAIAWRPDQEDLLIPYQRLLREVTRNK